MRNLYDIKKRCQEFALKSWTKFSPHWGLSRYFPFLKRFAERVSLPPRVPKNERAVVRARSVTFPLYVSENDPNISARIYADHIWERNETFLFEHCLKAGTYFLDLGAHLGYYSVLAGIKVQPGGRIFSFEPDPKNYSIFKRNIELNHLENVITPIPKAAAHFTGTQRLYGGSKDDHSDRTLFNTGRSKYEQEISCVRVGDYLAQHHPDVLDKVNLVKIDIEGFEPYACEGMGRILKNPSLILFTELNYERLRQAGFSARRYLERLRDFGFRIWVIDPHKEFRDCLIEMPWEEIARDREDHLDLYCVKKRRPVS